MASRPGGAPREWLDIPDPIDPDRAPPGLPPPLDGTPSLTRAEVARRRALALVLGLGWVLGSVGTVRVRPGIREHAAEVFAQAGLWALLALLGLYATLGRGRGRLGTPPWVVWLVAIAVPAMYLGLAFLWIPGASEANYGLGTLRQLGSCSLIGLGVAVPVLAAAGWALRRSFVNAAGWRGAAIGVSSGLGAATVLVIHCGIAASGHVAVGHGLPLVAAAVIGAFVGVRAGRA